MKNTKKALRLLALLFTIGGTCLFVTGCDSHMEDAAESTGDAIEDAAEETGDAVEDATD